MSIKATLQNMTVAELRKLAGQFHITGRSTMKKDMLVRELSDPDIADVVELSISVAETDEITADDETMSAIAEAEAETIPDEVAITKFSANGAIATAAVAGTTVGATVTRERGRWVLRYAAGAPVWARTLNKVAKQWAKRLGLVGAKIDVSSMS